MEEKQTNTVCISFYSLLQCNCPEAFKANTFLFILPLSGQNNSLVIWKKISNHLNRNGLIRSRTLRKLAIVNKPRIVFSKTILSCVNKSLSIG